MDPIKELVDFQKQMFENFIPKKYMQQFEDLYSSFSSMDPGVFLKQYQDVLNNLTQNLPMNDLQNFFKTIKKNSDQFLKLFQVKLENPMEFFQKFMGNISKASKPAPKSSS
jgi:hypothetical protein